MKLIEGWAQTAFKLWSIRLAALAAVLAGVFTAAPGLLLGLLAYLPDGPWRTVCAVLIGVVTFVIPAWSRLAAQPKLSKDDPDAPC